MNIIEIPSISIDVNEKKVLGTNFKEFLKQFN